jgi:hypothetical protein
LAATVCFIAEGICLQKDIVQKWMQLCRQAEQELNPEKSRLRGLLHALCLRGTGVRLRIMWRILRMTAPS